MVAPETVPSSRPLRLTQARIGDSLQDGDGARVVIVNAFTTVNPETAYRTATVENEAAPGQPRPVCGC